MLSWLRHIPSRINAFFLPLNAIAIALQEIAVEIKILRELAELELSSRSTALIRITESPKKGDTEIFYGLGPEDEKEQKRQALADQWADDLSDGEGI